MIKPAEDGSPDVIVRLYEAKRTFTRCTLATPLAVKAAELTDMLERAGRPIDVAGGKITLEFRPFEIKTVRLRLGS
jgi:alpha-mannosidase